MTTPDLRYHDCRLEDREHQYDARGIYLCFTCPKCHKIKMERYRPDVLTDPNYWADEDIYDDDEGEIINNHDYEAECYEPEDHDQGDLDCERGA